MNYEIGWTGAYVSKMDTKVNERKLNGGLLLKGSWLCIVRNSDETLYQHFVFTLVTDISREPNIHQDNCPAYLYGLFLNSRYFSVCFAELLSIKTSVSGPEMFTQLCSE